MIYIAVGFKVNQARSIFYIKEKNLSRFIVKVKLAIMKKDPDFISIRRSTE